MPLLKSLICLQGFDNGRRFLTINSACYFFWLLLSPALPRAAILVVLLLAIATPLLFATARRRIRDAGFSPWLVGLPPLAFWLCLLGVTYLTSGAKWSLLIIAVLVTLAVATISNARVRRKRNYTWGYAGPVEFGAAAARAGRADRAYRRIEPTLTPGEDLVHKEGGEHQRLASLPDDNFEAGEAATYDTARGSGWEQELGAWLVAHQGLTLLVSAGLVAMVLVAFLWTAEPVEVKQDPLAKPASLPKARLDKLEMPDDFWIMLDQNDALTIAWQGDFQQDGEYWSALTGKGDKSCVEVSFKIGDSYRSVKAEVKNQGDYYVDFSPVDTPRLVAEIALKDRFILCGYEFSLKGTQAILMSHPRYASILESIP